MIAMKEALNAHLKSGATTLCRAWAVTRSDGIELGFTDHDCDLSFDGIVFRAGTGLTARSLMQSTGLSVDNSEALGVLTSGAVREADIEAGRYDGAEVRSWLVNWVDVSQRALQFRGSLGEIRRAGGAFEAELRGLTEGLNQPLGRVFQKPCSAVLGDASCRFDLNTAGYRTEIEVKIAEEGQHFTWDALPGFGPEWFDGGRLTVWDGAAKGLWAAIRSDRSVAAGRQITLWQPIRAQIAPGDRVELTAGCDKRFSTCRLKFDNLVNFQGFPDIPGEDWLMAVPKQAGQNTGGSRR
ncbi:DUF2163 domain-containing protein [Tritonibacter horizontis]|uniref:Bacteriophage phiJL001 Gp84 C-terminal domain-containing protein n=1 Tax=Tritonibacter horizontis TaxID=1768241 RepID=A0A132BTL5_9RHOB|nr:DUF2163 domain-containing protein [Tritonibacter horizontis]KUP91711.1 hypothetical protein TRIHO_33720 [Tritonibacter horizontis]